MKAVLLATCGALFSMYASAQDVWECNNAVLLSLCHQQHNCTRDHSDSSSDKLRISVQNQRHVSICANNACWNGEATTTYVNSQPLLQLQQIRWVDRDHPQTSQNYILSINRNTQSIFFKGDRDNHPVRCRTV